MKRKEGRIFKYDITGGRHNEESDHHSIGVPAVKDDATTTREHYRLRV